MDGLFCTRSEIPPVRRGRGCEGEQSEEDSLRPISQNKKKKISQSEGFALAATLL